MPGGSTLGNIASTRVPIRTIDIGLPQLAMHSAMETAGVLDLCDYVALCRAFYGADIKPTAENGYTMEA
jgi:aspartyl aminopeptidase